MSHEKTQPFVVSSRFVFRSPLLPFDVFTDWAQEGAALGPAQSEPDALQRACTVLRERLDQALSRADITDALFLASPGLQEAFAHWRAEPDTPQGLKIERALVRYFARMAGRATPFGLFSGVAVGRVGKRTDLALGPCTGYRRYTRLDNDYLFALADALGRDPAIRRDLTYRPNDSLFRAAGRLRYAEAVLDGKVRSYRLVTVEPTDYLDRTLERARPGARLDELAAALVADDPEIELAEAEGFVHELVDSQILVSELTCQLTGREPIHGIIESLRQCPAAVEVRAALERAASELAAIDAAGPGVDPARYRDVATPLAALPVDVELSRLFQVDMVKPSPDAMLGPEVIATVERGVALLHRITPSADSDPLAGFRRDFRERYGDREVPLLEALDEEVGIGFEASNAPAAEASPLLAGLPFPPSSASGGEALTQAYAHLLRRVVEVIGAGGSELELIDDDIEKLASAEPRPLPDAFSVLATVGKGQGAGGSPRAGNRVFMGGGGGPSGANLSGRFCHASEEIRLAVVEHLRAEEALRPDAVFAEIVHLNEGRIGNILCRPVLRDYEIPYMGRSGTPRDRQIGLDDLMVSVPHDRVILRSRTLDREVVPRLTAAHNFRFNSVGVYRFLCKLQFQGTSGFGWSFGPLDALPFLPRVTRGELVFARARWSLDAGELATLAEASRPAKRAGDASVVRARIWRAMQALRTRRGLPRLVLLVDGDNELPIDLDNVLSCDTFVHLVRKRRRAVICEMFPAPDELVAEGPEGRYASQVVLSFTRRPGPVRSTAGSPARLARDRGRSVVRCFFPGSQWLYAKLYAGTASCDDILRETIAELGPRAVANGSAESCFFIRYGDPHNHLRVRWRGDPPRLTGEVLPALERAVRPLLAAGMIWRVQLDTYEREVERYGGPCGIELAEQLFWIDSETVLAILDSLAGDEGADVRWRLAVAGADRLLGDLGLDLAAKRDLMRRARDSMAREFRAGTAFHKQVGARFRAERNNLGALLEPQAAARFVGDERFGPGLTALERRSERMRPIIAELVARERRGQLDRPIVGFAWSYVHMYINRLLRSAQRAHELVIYDFLRRTYDGWAAREGSNA